MDYIKAIKDERKRLGVTQEMLADVAGVSVSSIKLIEQGKMNPTIQMLELLLDCLGLELTVKQKESYVKYEDVSAQASINTQKA